MEELAVKVERACEMAAIGRTTGYKLIAEGKWPVIRVGRCVRVPVEGLRRWLAQEMEKASNA